MRDFELSCSYINRFDDQEKYNDFRTRRFSFILIYSLIVQINFCVKRNIHKLKKSDRKKENTSCL